MSRCKKLSEEIIHKNPWWEYKHDEYTMPNEPKGDYYYGETFGNSMVVPVLDDGRLVLINMYRYLADKSSIEFPCGGMNKGETAQACAERELLEETGCSSSNFLKVSTFDGLNGLIKDTTHVFVANELNAPQKQQLESSEDIQILYRRPDEFEMMVKHGEIWDGQTLAVWALVRDMLIKK